MNRRLLLIQIGEPPYRYDKFSILLQSQQTCIRLGLYLWLCLASWTVAASRPPARVNICDTIKNKHLFSVVSEK
jgi:hypothetical protein